MVTHFAEDAEYFFGEGYDALSKVEHKYKNPDDILNFLYYYENGFEKLNKKLGKQLSLSNIKFKTEDIGVLKSIFDKLPYYLLYGEYEQFERTKCHIDKIRQSLREPNKLDGVLIIDEICKFLIKINNHIGKKEILPHKRSFFTESIRRRYWKIVDMVISSLIVVFVLYLVTILHIVTT